VLDAQTPAGTRIGAPLVAVDAEGQEIVYSITDASGRFGIDPQTAQLSLTVATNFDYEVLPDGVFTTIVVQAQDALGALASKGVAVRVANINEARRVAPLADQLATAGEDFSYNLGLIKDGSTIIRHFLIKPVWLQHRVQGNYFNVYASGDVLAAHIGTYTVSVLVFEGASPRGWQQFALTVIEPGRIVVSGNPALNFARRQGDFALRLGSRPHARPVTVAVSGAGEVELSPQQLVFAPDDWNVLQTVAVAVRPTLWLGERDHDYEITLAVADPDRGDLSYRDADAVVMTNAYLANQAPRWRQYSLQIAENKHDQKTVPGTRIGPPLLAVDREGHRISYRLDDASNLFGIDATAAQISVTVATNFDYEQGPNMHVITVHAQDEFSAASQAAFTIKITDIDEPARLSLANRLVPADADFFHRIAVVEHDLAYVVRIVQKPQWLAYNADSRQLSASAAILAENIGAHTISVQLVSPNLEQIYDRGSFVLDVFQPGSLTVSEVFVLRPSKLSATIAVGLGARPYSQPVTVSITDEGISDQVDFFRIAPRQLVFDVNNWDQAQSVTISVQPEFADFSLHKGIFITMQVADPENSDPSYRQAAKLRHTGYYIPNATPYFETRRLQIAENIHQETTPAGTGIGSPLVAVDKEDGALQYSIADASGLFAIDPVSAQVSVRIDANFDYEAVQNIYVITVSARDSFAATGATTVTIEVTDVDEPPRLALTDQVAAAGADFSYRPGVTEYGIAYLVHIASKPDWLQYDQASGQLQAQAEILAGNIGVHAVSVQLTDRQQNVIYDAGSLLLSVVNHGRVVVSAISELKVDRTSIPLQVMLADQPPTASVTVAVSASAEVAVAPVELSFGAPNWNVAQTIRVSIRQAVVQQNVDADFEVLLSTDRQGSDIHYKYAPATVVAGQYVANSPPQFASVHVQVAENGHGAETAAGTPIGLPLTAVDPEDHQLTYTIEDASGLFGIDEVSAQLSLTVAVDLDYEATPNFYLITVQAKDAFGARAAAAVSIEITDTRELPGLAQLEDQLVVAGNDFIYFLPMITNVRDFSYHSETPEWMVFAWAIFDQDIYTYSASGEDVIPGVYTLTVQATARDDDQRVVDRGSFVLTVLQSGNIEASLLPAFGLDRLTATVSVRLDFAPVGNVTVAVGSSDASLAAATTPQLTFTAQNWNQYQLVTVSITPGVVQENVDREFSLLLQVYQPLDSDIHYTTTPRLQLSGSYRSNGSPEFAGSSLLVLENLYEAVSPAGTDVGSALVARDREDDQMVYSIVGDSDLFGIDAQLGQLAVKMDVNFDYEKIRGAHTVTVAGDTQLRFARSANAHTVTVKAVDRHGYFGLATVDIQIADINEPPRLGRIADLQIIDNRNFSYRIDYAQNAEIALHSSQNRNLHSVTGLPAGTSYSTPAAAIVLTKSKSGSLTPGRYQVTVRAVDEQDAGVHDEKTFILEIVERGNLEAESLPRNVYGRNWVPARVRISHAPDRPVTVTVRATPDEKITVSPDQLVFTPDNWEQFQSATASLSANEPLTRQGVQFSVRFAVFERGASDLRYRQTAPIRLSSAFKKSPIVFAAQTITINENSYNAMAAVIVTIGQFVQARHLEDDDASFSYRIDPPHSLFFIKDAAIVTRKRTNFNYETGPQSYTLAVLAEDTNGGSVLAQIKIEVADINEPPRLARIANQRAIIGREFALTVAAATDEDAGQQHQYSALVDGGALPDWLTFIAQERKFSIAANAPGLQVGTYQVKVAVADDGSPALGAARAFQLTVAEPGRIETSQLPDFSRESPQHQLSVRLGVRPDNEVTVALNVVNNNAADLSEQQLIFTNSSWQVWQTVQVSLSAATEASKYDIDFVIAVAVDDPQDEIYLYTNPVQVAGQYTGPGNQPPTIFGNWNLQIIEGTVAQGVIDYVAPFFPAKD
ncbi:MAG: hypothetical protein OXC81_00990, partial [Betaproteobacteria bacterium]|nr:hypothetical protein [Betaproteobacteria bacterium]